MKKLVITFALTAFALAGALPVYGQDAQPSPPKPKTMAEIGITPNGVLGEVKVIDPSLKGMTIKTDAGESVVVLLSEETIYMRVPPGEKDLKKATKIKVSEVGVGDRVFARGRVADDQKSVPARVLIVMTKADLAQKRERDRAEWRRRGVLGVISALNPETKEITLEARTREGVHSIIIPASADNVKFRRYAPDSIKFSDAKPSSFAELKVGDQLRALGERSADGTRFTPEEIVSGSFRTVGGTVAAVNPQANEIEISDLQSQQKLTIAISKDSTLRRVPAEFAAMMAMRAEGGEGPRGTVAQGARSSRQGGENRPATGPTGGEMAGRRRAGGGGGGGPDVQEMLERLPIITVGELKPGDMIIVSSTTGADPSRVTAITLVAGVDALLQGAARRRGGAQPGGAFDLPDNTFGLGIGLPQ